MKKKNKDLLNWILLYFSRFTLGNIVYLFEINGLTIHGGSIFRRQNYLLLQFRLAKFLHISHLAYINNKFYDSYIDKFLPLLNMMLTIYHLLILVFYYDFHILIHHIRVFLINNLIN